MKHTRKKSNGRKRHMLLLPVFLVAVVALILGAASTELSAWWWPELVDFDEAMFFIEVNSTDSDIGVQTKVDGEAWKWLKIVAPNGRIFYAEAKGALRELGLTELLFESEEPTYADTEDGDADTSIPEFLEDFPEGRYRFYGYTVEGDLIKGKFYFSHDIPCGPVITNPEEEDGVLEIDECGRLISWQPVTHQLDDEGECDDEGDTIDIAGYQVVVEYEFMVDDTERVFQFVVDLPPPDDDELDEPMSITVPEDFFERMEGLDVDGEYKVEVVAIAANGNRTATEHEFELDEDE